MTLGEKLKQARLDRGLSQKQAAGTQITRNMLSLLEADRANPSMRTLEYLAEQYGLPVSWFVDERMQETPALDAARQAYGQQRWALCLELLSGGEETDEGQLLRTHAALCLAQRALDAGSFGEAQAYGNIALEANRGLYQDEALERQAALLLARCALELGQDFEKALCRYLLCRSREDAAYGELMERWRAIQ